MSHADDRPRLSLPRKLLYTLLTATVGLGALELLAIALEPPPPGDQDIEWYPPPGPSDEQTLVAELFTRRQRHEQNVLVDAPIVMVGDEARGWRMAAPVQAAPGRQGGGGPQLAGANRLGLRADVPAPREGELRLMALGDSSVYGHGVEESRTFVEVAAQELSRRWDRSVLAVNGGVPGYTSSQSLAALREVGEACAPTWIVVGNLWSDVHRLKANETFQAASRPVHDGLSWFALYRTLDRLLNPVARPTRVGWIDDPEDVGGDDAPCRVDLPTYVANLEAMATWADAHGAQPVFLVLPAPLDLDEYPEPATIVSYRDAMKQVARDRDAPLIDGPELFRGNGATLGYFEDRVHPTLHGHALLGWGIAEVLEPLGLPGDETVTGTDTPADVVTGAANGR